jgi:signal transduction histidine kinase
MREANTSLQHMVAHEIGDDYPEASVIVPERINEKYQDIVLLPGSETNPGFSSLMGPTASEYHLTSSQSFEADLREYLRHERSMFISEGTFFIVALIVGIVILHAGYRRERELARRQELFISTISHELNTPLASMRLALETMMRNPKFASAAQSLRRLWLGNLHLSQIVKNVLDTQWVENPGKEVEWRETPLLEMLERIVRDQQELIREEGIEIELAISERMLVCTDYRALQIVLSNLLRNAMQYGGSPAAVRVEADRAERKWWIAVEDNGNGIPEAERKRVFSRFYRTADERGKHLAGTGLGLYLVQRLVRTLRGNIRVQEGSSLGGARFLLTFKEVRRCPTG